MNRRSLAPLFALLTVACGGGGGSPKGETPTDSPFLGNYAGSFTANVTGTMAPDAANPPATGSATVTVNRFGNFTANLGDSYTADGEIRPDGSTAGVHVVFHRDAASSSAFPGTASFTVGASGLTGNINGFRNTTDFAHFTLTLTQAP